ncbi:MAG: hypothetical protein Q8O67_08355 [Deltaproteobacteria bacterium]|nr:hypothetical protein [Deltaproteobacteria bacterium]
MQKLIFVVAVIAAVAACKPAEERSAARRAEVERRAEVQESERRNATRDMGGDSGMAPDGARPGSPDMPDTVGTTGGDVAESAKERSEYQQKALDRLSSAETKFEALMAKASTSTKGKPIVDAVVQDANRVKNDLMSLRQKIPSMMQAVTDANWSMTKKSIDDQVKDIEDRLGKLDKRL